MSDLTRLNPTPHAIAVYASQPLSPVATQHSLPSRTLPFTWAGLSPAGSHQLAAGALIPVTYGTLLVAIALLTTSVLFVSSAQHGLASTLGQQHAMSGQI